MIKSFKGNEQLVSRILESLIKVRTGSDQRLRRRRCWRDISHQVTQMSKLLKIVKIFNNCQKLLKMVKIVKLSKIVIKNVHKELSSKIVINNLLLSCSGQLKIIIYYNFRTPNACPICLDPDMENRGQVWTTLCGHLFCAACMDSVIRFALICLFGLVAGPNY